MLLHVALEVYPNLAVSVWHCALVFVCLLVSPSDQDLESEANPIAAHKLSLLATSTRFIIFGPGFFLSIGTNRDPEAICKPLPFRSSTTRLSKGERPVFAPEKAANAPVDKMAEPFS